MKRLHNFLLISFALLPSIAVALCASAFSLFGIGAQPVRAEDGAPFTIVVLPDTQLYSQYVPEIFEAQTAWIAAHKNDRNIVFVSHVGDIVNYPQAEDEWKTADKALSILDGVVPYGIAPGNHDFTRDGSSKLYSKYFPASRFQKLPGWGGSFAEAHQDPKGDKSSYRLFRASGQDFLALNLEFCPTDQTLEWAGEVLSAHPHYKAIVTTHSFLVAGGARSTTSECAKFNHEGLNAGEEIWQTLVEKQHNHNIVLFLSGHDIHTTTGGERRTDFVDGRPIYQLLSNYQQFENGGNGYLRIMTFMPTHQRVLVETYSPVLDTYLTDDQNFFELKM